jgi:hypothetical protein
MIKPIHKFNGGLGATLCNKCRKIITEGMTEYLYCEECDPAFDEKFAYKLVRSDGLKKRGDHLKFIEWNDDSTFKQTHDEPAVGRSIVLDGNKLNYTWMTTVIEEIFHVSENYVKFKTKNSIYELFINTHNI